ncbi:MAG: hypothetical protein ABWW70_06590 [Thermoproteota archaeon]
MYAEAEDVSLRAVHSFPGVDKRISLLELVEDAVYFASVYSMLARLGLKCGACLEEYYETLAKIVQLSELPYYENAAYYASLKTRAPPEVVDELGEEGFHQLLEYLLNGGTRRENLAEVVMELSDMLKSGEELKNYIEEAIRKDDVNLLKAVGLLMLAIPPRAGET